MAKKGMGFAPPDWFFNVAGAAMAVVCSMVGFGIPLFAMRIGASVFELGMVGTMGPLCYTAACLFTGRMADRFRPKRMMLLGGVLYGAFYGAIVYAERVWQIAVVAGLGGASIGLFWPPLAAWIAEGRDRKALARALGGYNVAWCTGVLFGPLMGGVLFEADFRLPFWGSAALAWALMGLLLTVSGGQRDSESQALETASEEEPVQDRRVLYAVWIANFVSYFIVGAVRNLFPKLAATLGIEPKTLGVLMAVIPLAQLGAFMYFRRADGSHDRIGRLMIAQGMAIVGMALIMVSQRAWLFAMGFVLSGVLIGTSYSLSLFHSLYGQAQKGANSGLNESIVGSGVLVGPFLGGWAAAQFGLRTPYVLCGVLLGVAMAVEGMLIRSAKRRRARGMS
ncbi:MAG: MFS transporter [Candidatus Latescibacteria bacterium]|nr:MFS transporter [Candidatus Latescibacterota bacterium]